VTRTLVVVQARVGSTRLPGKVLLPLWGQPALVCQLERILAAPAAFELCVATSTAPVDQAIVDLCRAFGVPCVVGHPTDLLERHLAAARAHRADVVVKIPSDCPLIDPAAIAHVLGAYDGHDYLSNLHPGTWPDGNDVEVMARDALELAGREAQLPFQREHTTPFLWDQPHRFRVGNVRWPGGRDLSRSHRFTLDYPEDYRFIRAVYDELGPRPFGLGEILALLETRPDLRRLNQRHLGYSWMNAHQHELATLGDHP
jgi:spore coat polysaccharide biosynthesis protein SpsF